VGAPKLGDKSTWEPRIKKGGADALTASVIAGKGVMAPRAGVPSLSDTDIKAAVEYMINAAK
jgi:cytochrome c5